MNNINFPQQTIMQSEVSNGAGYQNGKYAHPALRLHRLSLIVAMMTLAIIAVSIQNACAGKPPLSLTLNGAEQVQIGKSTDNIEVRLVNPGKAAADSRLRVFIHDQQDRDIQTNDIKIELLDKAGWRPLSVEAIDGGVMVAIGAAGDKHHENHKKGGFGISSKATQVWQIRLTLRLMGQYTLVVAVSPDNGATHLAKPASMKIEAL